MEYTRGSIPCLFLNTAPKATGMNAQIMDEEEA